MPVPGEEEIFVIRGYGMLASDFLALRQLLSVSWPTG